MRHELRTIPPVRNQGFTLIEIIVVVIILIALLGITIASYSSYNTKQKVKQAALDLKSNLRMARTNAVSGKKPEACATYIFEGYQVNFYLNSYDIIPKCKDADSFYLINDEKKTVELPPGIEFDPIQASIVFHPLTQGVDSSTPNTLTLTDHITSVTLQIDPKTGEVSD